MCTEEEKHKFHLKVGCEFHHLVLKYDLMKLEVVSLACNCTPHSAQNSQNHLPSMIHSLFNTVDLCCEGFVDFHELQDLSLGM